MRFSRQSLSSPRDIARWRLALRSLEACAVMIASAIIAYPAPLALFFWSGRIATGASDERSRAAGWAGTAVFITLALSLPLLGFVVARAHATRPLSRSDSAIRRMAHLTWMAPPLYTATGVWLLIFGLPGWTAWGLDAAVWVLLWLVILALLVLMARRPSRAGAVRSDSFWLLGVIKDTPDDRHQNVVMCLPQQQTRIGIINIYLS